SNPQSPISTFLRDRRGATVATYAVVLPLFFLVIFGSATLWRVISIKQSVDVVTYEAARYLSREGRRIAARALPYYDAEGWRRIALDEIDPWIQEQVRRNPFVDAGDVIEVDVDPPVDVDCNPWGAVVTNDSRAPENIGFTVRTKVTLASPIQVPFMEPFVFSLQESHREMVECPRFRGNPPDEGEIFLPRGRR
ncbi:MAG: TadE/TadG family type IV pilus assembly protein, partial [Anaerolineae bacterium]